MADQQFLARHKDLQSLQKELEKHGPDYIRDFLSKQTQMQQSAHAADKQRDYKDSSFDRLSSTPSQQRESNKKRLWRYLADDTSMMDKISPAAYSDNQRGLEFTSSNNSFAD